MFVSNAASHQAILQATLELFAEVGLAGLSIEGIAERAQARGEVRADLEAGLILLEIFLSLVLGSLFAEFIDPNAQCIYAPETTVDVLLRSIGTAPGALAYEPGADTRTGKEHSLRACARWGVR